MEIIIGIIFVIIVALVFFSRKPKVAEVAEPVPYKVETVEPTPTPVVEEASQAMVESIAPAKKPRAPRKPKAEAAKKAPSKTAPAKKTTTRKPKAK